MIRKALIITGFIPLFLWWCIVRVLQIIFEKTMLRGY